MIYHKETYYLQFGIFRVHHVWEDIRGGWEKESNKNFLYQRYIKLSDYKSIENVNYNE